MEANIDQIGRDKDLSPRQIGQLKGKIEKITKTPVSSHKLIQGVSQVSNLVVIND